MTLPLRYPVVLCYGTAGTYHVADTASKRVPFSWYVWPLRYRSVCGRLGIVVALSSIVTDELRLCRTCERLVASEGLVPIPEDSRPRRYRGVERGVLRRPSFPDRESLAHGRRNRMPGDPAALEVPPRDGRVESAERLLVAETEAGSASPRRLLEGAGHSGRVPATEDDITSLPSDPDDDRMIG